MTLKRLEYKGLIFDIPEEVYEPADDSFMLAEEVEGLKAKKVLDVGTGSGIQAIVASGKAREVVACDINPKAVKWAGHNAHLNGIENMEVILSDLLVNIEGKFDLIIFNPPYLPSNPEDAEDDLSRAWDGGVEGREVIDTFLAQFMDHLAENGTLLLLQSSRNNLEKTTGTLREMGLWTTIVAEESFFFEKLYVLRAQAR